MEKTKSSFVAKAGFSIAIVSGLAAILSGTGTRLDFWNFRTGLTMLRWAAYGGLAAMGLSLIGLFLALRNAMTRTFIFAFLGFFLGAALVAIPMNWLRIAKNVPPIHDITTDTTNPPKFAAILPLRKNALNPPEYGGPAIEAQQLKAYPDIVPLMLKISPDMAFDKALFIARKMGWKIVNTDRGERRIEASDTTFWFGFKDDIVIRMTKEDSGSRVDIRSVSRVGKSDVGTNAKRIRRFLREMKKP